MSDDLKIATKATPAISDTDTAPSAPNTYNFNQSGEGTILALLKMSAAIQLMYLCLFLADMVYHSRTHYTDKLST